MALAKVHLILGDLNAVRQEAPLALAWAEQLGYLPALVLSLTMNTIVAKIDRRPEVLASNIRRLRVLHDGSTSLDLKIPERLEHLAQIIGGRHDSPYGQMLVKTLIDLLQSLGHHKRANSLQRQWF